MRAGRKAHTHNNQSEPHFGKKENSAQLSKLVLFLQLGDALIYCSSDYASNREDSPNDGTQLRSINLSKCTRIVLLHGAVIRCCQCGDDPEEQRYRKNPKGCIRLQSILESRYMHMHGGLVRSTDVNTAATISTAGKVTPKIAHMRTVQRSSPRTSLEVS